MRLGRVCFCVFGGWPLAAWPRASPLLLLEYCFFHASSELINLGYMACSLFSTDSSITSIHSRYVSCF